MRFWGWLILAGCSFQKSLAPADGPSVFDDAGREIRTWDFDTAADFGGVGGEAIDMTIDPLGSITPEGYVYGALLARGVQGVKLWSGTDATPDWSKTTTVNPVGYGLWNGSSLDVDVQELAFVGITETTMVSVWFEGELWINPNETFRILGNDTAFLYAALDGTTFQKFLHNNGAVIPVTTAGWYPVRIGWADGDNSGGLDFDVNPTGGFVPIEHTRLRATTSQLRGTFRHVFYRQVHGGGVDNGGPVMSIQETPLHATTAFDPPLPGSFTSTTTLFDWSARWTGQFYANAAGTYTLRVVSDDGNRIQLGAITASNGFTRDANGQITTNISAELVAGWNDLVVDYNHVSTPPTFTLTVVDAPAVDAALEGAPIPRERLRPIEPRSDRLIPRSNFSQPVTILDNQGSTYAVLSAPIAAHPGELATSLALTARVTTPNPSQLQFRVILPNATNATVAMTLAPDPNGNGSHLAAGVFTPPAGTAANGIWQLGIADNSNSGPNGNSTYHELHVTAHTTMGREQIAKKSMWRSPIVENKTSVTLIDFVNWSERKPAGTSVTFRMRTCAMASCADGVWSDVANGSAPMLPPHRFIQLEVEMTTAGIQEPEVDKISIQYRTEPAM